MSFVFVWCIKASVYGVLDPNTQCHQIKPLTLEVCTALKNLYRNVYNDRKVIAMCLRDL